MSSLLDYGRAGRNLAEFDIVDMHAHLGAYSFPIPDLSVAGVVRVMDRLGVRQTLCSHMRCMSADTARGNREVLAAMQAFPGRILGYASAWPSSIAAVETETAWSLANGFTGFKLHNSTGFEYTSAAYTPMYAAAHAHRMPILFHTWGDEKTLKEIRLLAREYPDASLLMAHTGCCNLPEYLRLAHDCDNVYLELALSRADRGLLETLVAGAGAEKVIWGSDIYFLSQPQQLGRVLGARISEEEKLLILSGNARRILGKVSGVGCQLMPKNTFKSTKGQTKPPAGKPALSWRIVAPVVLLVALAGFTLADLISLCSLNYAGLWTLHSQLDDSFSGVFPLLHADEVVDFIDDGKWDSGMYVSCQYAIAPVRIDYADYLARTYTHPHVIEAFPPDSEETSPPAGLNEYQVVKKFEDGVTIYQRK
jgi:predicted TIM-barrel fold metal-dependent hydrolase